jgi:hypothetical protein
MKALKDMSAAELVGEVANSDPAAYDQDKRNAALAEVTRRLEAYDELEDALEDSESARKRRVDMFAHSATTAVVGLWMAHGGRPIEPSESPDLAKCLFEFFSKIR